MGSYILSTNITTQTIIKMELGYWGIQGLAQPARLLLNYQTKEKFTFVDYTSPAQWQADKKAMDSAFPNIPYLKTKEHGTIVQSGAVIRFLGMHCGLQGSPAEQVQAEIVDGAIQDMWTSFMKLMFNKAAYEAEKEAVHEKMVGCIAQFSKHLASHKFMAGDSVTWVDFKALHIIEILSKFSSKIAGADKIAEYCVAVVASGNEEFQAYYAAEKERRPVFAPGYTAWESMTMMKDMVAE